MRAQASVHCGFCGSCCAESFAPFFLDLPSLPLRREKRPAIMGDGYRMIIRNRELNETAAKSHALDIGKVTSGRVEADPK